MKTVAADMLRFIELCRQGVSKSVFGHAVVKCRVKYGHIRDLGCLPAGDLDTEHVGRVMERGKRMKCFEVAKNLLIDQGRSVKLFSAVNNTVAYHIQLLLDIDDLLFLKTLKEH